MDDIFMIDIPFSPSVTVVISPSPCYPKPSKVEYMQEKIHGNNSNDNNNNASALHCTVQ